MTNRAVRVSTEDHFNSFLDAVAETGVPHLALFTAPSWCIPCRRFEPHWLKAQEMLRGYMMLNVDLGDNPALTGDHWATKEFGIRGVPTVKLFNDEGVHNIASRSVVPFVKEVKSYE